MSQISRSLNSRVLCVCDRVMLAGLCVLLLFSPVAFGSVHPWAFSLLEALIFTLVLVWMAKLYAQAQLTMPTEERSHLPGSDTTRLVQALLLESGEHCLPVPKGTTAIVLRQPRVMDVTRPANPLPFLRLCCPLFLFVGVGLLHLLPLPPAWLAWVSPATSTIYTHSLPGWPEQDPYREVLTQGRGKEEEALHTVANIEDERVADFDVVSMTWELFRLELFKEGVPWDSQQSLGQQRRKAAQRKFRQLRKAWGEAADASPPKTIVALTRMPLSIAPTLTATTLLKFCAYTALFCLVLLYPIGDQASYFRERRFLRTLLVTMVVSGCVVGVIGIAQYFSWNGKILWFFVPKDWGSARPDFQVRASGPFVNSDHFANYLALIFPIVVGGLLSSKLFHTRTRALLWWAFCGVTLVVLCVSLLLSLSRGGLLAAAVGTLFVLWRKRGRSTTKRSRRRPSRRIVLPRSLIVAGCGAIAVGFVLLNPVGRDQLGRRVQDTLLGTSAIQDRVNLWQDSLGMIREFPIVGVGLGAWSEVFPRYQRPPWDPVTWKQAHNDYVQGFAETGVIGMSLLAWFFAVVGLVLFRGLRVIEDPLVSICAGLTAALFVMGFHEGFDFSLQIPANAVLFTIILGTGLRLTTSGTHDAWIKVASKVRSPLAIAGGIVAVLLGFLSVMQATRTEAVDPHALTSVAEVRDEIARFPARSGGHLAMVALRDETLSPVERAQELAIALWLEPLNPDTRDHYALAVLELGDQDDAIKQVYQSVLNAPTLASHFYLTADTIAVLDPAEVQAIEDGLRHAFQAGYQGAVDGLGGFYALVGRSLEQGNVYAEAARQESRYGQHVRYVREAGLAYAQAGEGDEAEYLLRQVIKLTPQDPTPYRTIVTDLLAPKGDLTAAKTLVNEGIANGADATTLLISLADAAEKAGDLRQASTILQDLALRRPSSFDVHFHLGALYLQQGSVDRAVFALHQAITIRDDSARAFFFLGQAEEKRYRFIEAEHAYARALALEPDDEQIEQQYEAVRQRLIEEGPDPGGVAGTNTSLERSVATIPSRQG